MTIYHFECPICSQAFQSMTYPRRQTGELRCPHCGNDDSFKPLVATTDTAPHYGLVFAKKDNGAAKD